MPRIVVFDVPDDVNEEELTSLTDALALAVSAHLGCDVTWVTVSYPTDLLYMDGLQGAFVLVYTGMLREASDDMKKEMTAAVAQLVKDILELDGDVECAIVHMDGISVVK